MKTCARCSQVKAREDFNRSPKSKDGLHSWCRQCAKERYRETAAAHKANVQKNNSRYLQVARGLVIEALSPGCVDCGVTDVRVLDLDHVVGEKTDGVMNMIRKGASLDRLKQEISKCEPRCRNCHAIATYSRMKNCWRTEYASVD